MAKIVNGTVDFKSDELDGLTVGEVKDEYGDILQIDSGARATIGEDEVADSRILGRDETVVFDQPTGSKG